MPVRILDDRVYLSIVIVTIFHVDAVNIPHKRNLLFHKRHSNVPRMPSLWIRYMSLIVNVVNNNITEATKSRQLYKIRVRFSQRKVVFDVAVHTSDVT